MSIKLSFSLLALRNTKEIESLLKILNKEKIKKYHNMDGVDCFQYYNQTILDFIALRISSWKQNYKIKNIF